MNTFLFSRTRRVGPGVLSIAASSVLLAACAVGPEYQAPQAELPAQWDGAAAESAPGGSRVETAAVQTRWWGEFGDPLLVEIVERASAANLDVQLAALRVAQSRAQRDIVAGNRAPNVAAVGSYQRQRQSELGSGTRLVDAIGAPADQRAAIIDVLSEPHDVFQAGFDASWELDLWGRVQRAVESANATLAASREDLHAAQLSLIAEVARVYFELRGVQEQLRIARDDVQASETALQLAESRAQGGLVTQLDVSSQRARLADARAQLPRLEHQQARLMNALALLLAEEPGALEQRLAAAPAQPRVPAIVSIGVPSQIARRRPDIRGAESRLQAATAEVGVAVADLYPRITLTAGFMSEALHAGDLGEWAARQWHVGPSLHLPIFEGGRRRSVVELRKLQQQEAAVSYQRTVLRAWHEIEDALDAYAAEQRRHRELLVAVASSRDAYEIATLHYQHGMTNFLVPLDAQRTMLQSERALAESRTAMATHLVSLYKALGGGWELADEHAAAAMR